MAKALKVIQCPKCGSTQKTEVRPDYFRCDSCGTEYFLDNDDININYNVRQEPQPGTDATKKVVLLGGLAGVVVVASIGLGLLFGNDHAATPSYTVAEEGYSHKFTFMTSEALLFLSPTKQPVLLQVGRRSYYRVTKDSAYAVFTDAGTGRVLQSRPLNVPPTSSAFPDFDLKQFSNGDLYFVANKAAVYLVDQSNFNFKDVTKTLFQGQSELSSGVATVEAGDNDYGDYFEIFTNDGRNLSYFPLTHTVYTKDDFYDARHSPRTLQANSTVKTRFRFSSRSTLYSEDKIQLIKYQQRDNGGGPQDRPRFEWSDDYGGSGIFTDADPHRKVLITQRELRDYRVLSFSDFTPGRLYFDPKLLAADEDYVLISFKPTAAPGARPSLQCLNARTGAIVFTQPLAGDDDIDSALCYPGGFVLYDGKATYALSLDGKLVKHAEAESPGA